MTKEKLRSENSKTVQEMLNAAVAKADKIHSAESELISMLSEIDKKRFYICSGYKSLRGFCIYVLRFTEIQSQRLVCAVRRSEPTPKIGTKTSTIVKGNNVTWLR